jgi:peptidoglycan hydrolase FlgJ
LTNSITAATGSASESFKPKNIEQAAQQFEAMFVTQMLESAKESNGEGALSGSGDAASDTWQGMANQQFAKLLTANGGLGLAKMIVSQLATKDSQA